MPFSSLIMASKTMCDPSSDAVEPWTDETSNISIQNHPFVDGVKTATIGKAGDDASRSQSDGGWTTTIALVLTILFYIWLGAAIIEKLAPVAGAQ